VKVVTAHTHTHTHTKGRERERQWAERERETIDRMQTESSREVRKTKRGIDTPERKAHQKHRHPK
jgi:hypothetical protein